MIEGLIYLVVGATRSGKTFWVMQKLRKYKRVIVWDIKGDPNEFKDFYRCSNPLEFVQLLARAAKGHLKITYTGKIADFEWFCKLAYKWANDKACAIVVDELSDVTTISKAPPAWGQIIRKVLCTGTDVFVMAQRPAEIDKTTVGNASVLHVHRMSRKKDREYMASEMDVETSELTLGNYSYIEKDNMTQKINRYTHTDRHAVRKLKAPV